MRTARHHRRGYTAVEVLSAMTLFAIGAAGVIGMQKVTIQGGQDARRLDVATNIAHEWTARLQRDAMSWTLPSNKNRTTQNLTTHTRWLSQVGMGPCTPPSYCTPPTPAAGGEAGFSPAFDIFGRDRPSGTADHAFCVQYRLWWGRPLGNAPNFFEQASIHADIRVFWSRLELSPIGDCSSPTISPDAANANEVYHFIYASTVVRSSQESPQ
jgi:prepilin-type N-terminal cleavage/methylation domain-containing protein